MAKMMTKDGGQGIAVMTRSDVRKPVSAKRSGVCWEPFSGFGCSQRWCTDVPIV